MTFLLKDKKMNISTKLIAVLTVVVLSGCASVFTPLKEVAVDKLYVQKQCPTFNHSFDIPGKKYQSNDVSETSVVMKLEDLTLALSSNTKAREIFNASITESNKETLVKDESVGSDAERVVKRIYVNRECPKYYYVPEFNAKKLTPTFTPASNTTYVVIPLEKMMFQMEKHKKEKDVFNESVDDLNKKPFPLNLIAN